MKFVVLAVLVAFAAAVPLDSVPESIALLQLEAAKNALKVNVEGHFFLDGWDQLELKECSDCPEGKITTKQCSITHDTECGDEDDIPAGHVRTSAGTFRAETMTDSEGRTWVMTHRWADKYQPKTDAFGDWDTEGDAKLSDEQINSISTEGNRVYMFESPEADKVLYIATDKPHNDMAKSFGSEAQHGMLVAKNQAVDLDALDKAAKFEYASYKGSFDGYSVGGGQTCNRWFMGYHRNDCYSVGNGWRCMQGGASCGGHKRIPTKVYVLKK
jgi:hypothetical protein